MATDSLRVLITAGNRSFEVEGPKSDVNRLLSEYAEWVRGEIGQSELASPTQALALRNPDNSDTNTPDSEIPFGEYLHTFPNDVTDIDRALIAANYVQTNSDDNSFATREVNALLQEQGVRLSNPSQCIRRNTSARRIFSVSRGRFRVSREGQARLDELIQAYSV